MSIDMIVTNTTVETFNAEAARIGLKGVKKLTGDAISALLTHNRPSMGETVVRCVNLTEGRVRREEIDAILRASFPGNRVGDRHAAHYLSLARTGKLPGVTAVVPKRTRPGAGPKSLGIDQLIAITKRHLTYEQACDMARDLLAAAADGFAKPGAEPTPAAEPTETAAQAE